MSRSSWKGFYVSKSVLKNKNKKIWSRNSTIPFSYLNKKIFVYNGKEFKSLFITEEKIGFKFGEFIFTRTKGLKKNKKIKKNSK